jgi:tetratricopeptide (TPR) repeat protein
VGARAIGSRRTARTSRCAAPQPCSQSSCWRRRGAASHARARVWRDSESLYLASLAATPRNPLLLYNLGVIQGQQGRVEEATRSYEAALAIDPGHAAANTNLGNIQLRAGQTEQAIEHYRAALERDPDDVQTLQNLGRVLAWRGATAEALARLERAAELAPESASVRRDLDAVRAASESGGPAAGPLTASIHRDLLKTDSSSGTVSPIPAGT